GVGGEPLGFSEDLLAALMNRAPADRHRSGVERALAEFDGRGVSFGDFDVIWPQAERVGGDLRVAGGVPLAVVGGAAGHAARAGGVDQHPRILPAPVGKARRGVVPAGAKSGEFGVGGQPDSPVAAVTAELRLLVTQLLIANEAQGPVQVLPVVAAVEDE